MYSSCTFSRRLYVPVLLTVVLAKAHAEASIDFGTVVEGVRSYDEKLANIAITYQSTSETSYKGFPDITFSGGQKPFEDRSTRQAVTLRRKGEKYHANVQQFEKKRNEHDSRQQYDSEFAWDGSLFQNLWSPHSGASGKTGTMQMGGRREHAADSLWNGVHGLEIIGRFPGAKTVVSEQLGKTQDGSQGTITQEGDLVHLRTVSPEGEVDLWLSPAHGWATQKIRIVKTAGNLVGGEPLSQSIRYDLAATDAWALLPPPSDAPAGESTVSAHRQEIVFEVEQFREVSGTYVAEKARIQETTDFDGGRQVARDQSVVIDTVSIGSVEDAAGVFSISNVPDGTRVQNLDKATPTFEWRGGKIIPLVSNDDRSALEGLVTDLAETPSRSTGAAEPTPKGDLQLKPDSPSSSEGTSRVRSFALAAGGVAVFLAGLLAVALRRRQTQRG